MGQTQTKEKYDLPFGRNYSISYCRCYNVSKTSSFKNEINLIKLIPDEKIDYVTDLISSVFNYKIKFLGYSVVTKIPFFDKSPLNLYLSKIKIMNLKITPVCYNSNLNNIKYLLNKGNILIAGLIMDSEFINSVLRCDYTPDLVTDIVLIIGYTADSILIKTIWTERPIEVQTIFLNNFKEIWNIKIESPEEKYLINLNEL